MSGSNLLGRPGYPLSSERSLDMTEIQTWRVAPQFFLSDDAFHHREAHTDQDRLEQYLSEDRADELHQILASFIIMAMSSSLLGIRMIFEVELFSSGMRSTEPSWTLSMITRVSSA